jgi:formate-dependent nitrite reductase membrane component NrfD
MSVGVWALLAFGLFVAVSVLDTWVRDRGGRPGGLLGTSLGLAFNVVGAIFGLFLASYTGVLLSVSNQPVWSDTWALGGLFLASGLSGAAAAITLLVRYRPDASFSLERLRVADAYFSILELVLLVTFFITVALAGTAGRIVPWLPLWVIALIGIGASMMGIRRPARVRASGEASAIAPVAIEATVISIAVLAAVFAMRAAVIFSAQ